MTVRYTRNVLILALAAINLFFLAFFGIGLYRDNAVKRQMYRELYALMEQNGILLDTEGIDEGGEMYLLETSRSPDLERALAETLLGETESADRGGNITAYVGEAGEAVFHTGGEFEITFTQSVFEAGGSAQSATRKLLGTLGIEAAGLTVETANGNEIAAAFCTWSDYRIFNCRIQFMYKDGSLIQIIGKHPENIRKTSEKKEMSTASAATALLYFLRAVKAEKYSCAAIMDVQPGYSFAASPYGDGSLRPSWRIAADSGIFLIDALTGALQQVLE